ncbi:MAG: SoxR reducing system RseC family protein [Treponema sp.]|jgi:sigma-E factor negative regulatory protein RseC|nr:SoxR reducing system RseC family protein [Treponema sp.]
MIETGTVAAVTGGRITLRQDKPGPETCFGCMNQECKQRRGLITAKNPLELPLKPGQQVETELSPLSVIPETILALGIPVLGFAAGFFLTAAFFPAAGDPARAFGGVLLMLAFGLGFLLFRRRFPAKALPVVVRVLEPDVPGSFPIV